jgi:hypothetical protein
MLIQTLQFKKVILLSPVLIEVPVYTICILWYVHETKRVRNRIELSLYYILRLNKLMVCCEIYFLSLNYSHTVCLPIGSFK